MRLSFDLQRSRATNLLRRHLGTNLSPEADAKGGPSKLDADLIPCSLLRPTPEGAVEERRITTHHPIR
jgi:hypothetical protein